MAENRVDDALYFADEWFEWMDPNNYINESTHFYNEDELKELYESRKSEWADQTIDPWIHEGGESR